MDLFHSFFHRCVIPGLATSMACGILLLVPENSAAQIPGEKSANLGGRPQVIAFVNQTTEKLVVHWIDFDGVGREIGLMVPNQVAEITTFPGHLTTFSSGSRRVATFRASTISESAYAIAGSGSGGGSGGGAVNPGPTPVSSQVSISSADFGGQNHVTKQISLSRGGRLAVDLDSNASTGFAWGKQAFNTDESIARQLSHEFRGPKTAMPGAGGTEVWTFEALRPGVTTLIFNYSQGWTGGQKDARTLTVIITVR